MADMISRAAACECIGKMIHEYREKGEYALADGMILARRYGIKCLPAVSSVPVVRCRDCKYGEPDTNGRGEDMVMCQNKLNPIGDGDWLMPPEFFCADGERRDDE